ncbi:hypothetical protein AVEN_113772-1 [Araneus ventricosus]|uniref:Uncharacterized protein n=1 Tax=Araneus ventricosus TaxID=182803 RepID=A0A4Y2N9U0_ARAVE|nr:hypothetical protein AVEN_113772-1 [Araneus ventricosus]
MEYRLQISEDGCRRTCVVDRSEGGCAGRCHRDSANGEYTPPLLHGPRDSADRVVERRSWTSFKHTASHDSSDLFDQLQKLLTKFEGRQRLEAFFFALSILSFLQFYSSFVRK